jgi:hypothetical protein
MPDTEQTFHSLAKQFEVLERNLRASQSAEQRAELLKRMSALIVIEELDLIRANQSSLDSELSIAPNSGPYRSPAP